MEIHVYDTYSRKSDGGIIHFDVFMPEKDDEKAYEYAKEYLQTIGEDGKLTSDNCRFCHSQMARPDIEEEIADKGYYIFKMDGCPD